MNQSNTEITEDGIIEKSTGRKVESPMDLRIPADPERMTFSSNSTVADLQKWRHYSMTLIGILAMKEIEKRGLIIVPRNMFLDLLKIKDPEAFNVFHDTPTQRDQLDHVL